MTVGPRQRRAAEMMLEELESNRLEVAKVPGRDGEGYVRVPVTQNAPWYRDFCEEWTRPRRGYPKPRTIIRRVDTARALRELASGVCRSLYAQRLLPHVRRFADLADVDWTGLFEGVR